MAAARGEAVKDGAAELWVNESRQKTDTRKKGKVLLCGQGFRYGTSACYWQITHQKDNNI